MYSAIIKIIAICSFLSLIKLSNGANDRTSNIPTNDLKNVTLKFTKILNPIEFNINNKIHSVQIESMSCVIEYLHKHFDVRKSTGKTIYILISTTAEIGFFEEQFFSEFNGNLIDWSIQIVDLHKPMLDDFADTILRDQIVTRNFVWFYTGKFDFNDEMVTNYNNYDYLHIISATEIMSHEMTILFRDLYQYFGKNINLLVWRSEGKWTLFTYEFWRQDCYRQSKIEIREDYKLMIPNRCDRINLSEFNVNHNETCLLKVASINWPPFMYFDDYHGFYKGIEYFMVQAIATKLNMNVEYRYINTTEYYELVDTSDVFSDLASG